jgi:hypothetical protein
MDNAGCRMRKAMDNAEPGGGTVRGGSAAEWSMLND